LLGYLKLGYGMIGEVRTGYAMLELVMPCYNRLVML